MSKAREQFLAGTMLSALVLAGPVVVLSAAPTHAAPRDGSILLAQAPQADDKSKPKPGQPAAKPAVKPPAAQPPRPAPPAAAPPRPPSPPAVQRPQPPAAPPQRQVQPPPPPTRQVQPPPPPRQVQPPSPQRQVQPPPPPTRQVQPPPPPTRQVQPPSGAPPAAQQGRSSPPGTSPGVPPGQFRRPGLPPGAPPPSAQQPGQMQRPGGPPRVPGQAQQPPGTPPPSIQQQGQPPRPGGLSPVPGQAQQPGQRPGGPPPVPGQVQQPPGTPPGQVQRPGRPPPVPGQAQQPPGSPPPGAPPAQMQRPGVAMPPPGTVPVGQPPASTVQPGQPPGTPGRQFGQPRPPGAPAAPLAAPAIAPTALQPVAPAPAGSTAAQAQRAFVPPPAQDNARRLDDVRGARREVRDGNRVMIQEPGRVIIREGGRTIIRHNEADRFRWQARDVRIERRGRDTVTVFERPDGSRVYSVTDENGRLLRRYRRGYDGREIIIIDNTYRGPPVIGGYFVDLPPPRIRIPRERYIVEAAYAPPALIYGALMAPPVEPIERAYTLDEVRYSPRLLERMPRVDLDTVTFEFGSWELTPDQIERLGVIADGINQAVAANPSEVFLIEGHTDAVGAEEDNLSLSDRRAETVALALSQQFNVPAENLTTQGYGEQYLKVPSQGPERANRRVTVRRITPLLTGQNQAVPGAPPPQ